MDVLDRLLEDLNLDGKSAATALVKTADGFMTIDATRLEAEYGELTQIEMRSLTIDGETKEIPVYEQKATDEEKAAQEARAKKYSIGIKDSGSITMPKKWKDAGLSDADFADPTNYKFPVHDETHVKMTLDPAFESKNALSRWGNEDIKSQYTADEQKTVESRIKAAADKHGVDAESVTANKGAKETITVGGRSFDRYEIRDTLGRATYTFEHGDLSDGSLDTSFVHDGTVAKLRVPRGTTADDVRAILSELTLSKSADPGRRVKQGNTFDDALDDAMENLSVQALTACWYAYCSCIMDYWAGELEDLDDATFTQYTDQFAQALKDAWTKFGTAEAAVQAAIEGARLIRRGVKGGGHEKAGASISRANRDKLREAQNIIADLLDEEKDNAKDKGTSGTRTKGVPDAAIPSELERRVKETVGAEVGRLKADHDREMRELQNKLAERDALLDKFGKERFPDPAATRQPASAAAKSADRGPTIYDFLDDTDTQGV